MSEASNASQNEKAAKVRRKPERESPLSPTFAAARQTARNAQHQAQPSGGASLQRQCSCGKHTIGGGMCEECQQKGEGAAQVASQVTSDEYGEAISPDIQTSRESASGFNFSSIPAHTLFTSSQQLIQPNLMVNEPGDQYEQEADRVADTVMRMSGPSLPLPSSGIDSFFNPTVSRLPTISRIQTSGGRGGFQAPPHVEARINQMQSGGQPLPETERDFLEQRMGYDFSSVRVHTDANAVQASRDIQAQAFTMGNNIAFNEGAYRPGTNEGRHLLAHELTHVVQQGGAGVRRKLTLGSLMENTKKSNVLDHLQTLQRQSNLNVSLYRKEIDKFQQRHSTDDIAAKQQNVLELQKNVDIRESDRSQTLRRCGGGSSGPGGSGPPPAAGAGPKVKLPKIRASSTPSGMANDRIPPRVDTPISVEVSDWHPPMLPITLSIDGAGGSNGTATIDGGATADVDSNTTVQLRGGTQTTPGSGGNLKLVAKVGSSSPIATSAGFSVSAIPQNWTCTFDSLITGAKRGFVVQDNWQSDSGTLGDLNETEISEEVQYGGGTGVFAGISGNNSGYLPGHVLTKDSHSIKVSALTGIGKLVANQTSKFKDKRSGAADIPMKASGYKIVRETFNKSGALHIKTSKDGAPTTANGISSGAGTGSITKPQKV